MASKSAQSEADKWIPVARYISNLLYIYICFEAIRLSAKHLGKHGVLELDGILGRPAYLEIIAGWHTPEEWATKAAMSQRPIST